MNSNNQNKSRNKRAALVRVICLVLCVIMLGGLVTSALLTMASAKSSSELKKELSALQSEANKIAQAADALEKEMKANQDRKMTAIEQKSMIDKRIQITESEINNANAQIQQYSLLIAEKQSELEAARAEQQDLNERYMIRLRAMEEAGSISYWSVLFKANSFSDLLSRLDSIHEVAEADSRMLEEIQAKADEIVRNQAELEEELTAQQEAKTVLEELEQELLTQREEADKLMLELEEAYKSLSAEFLANEDEEAALRAQIMEAQSAYEKALSAEEAARLAAANKNNAAGSSAGKPGASGFISPLPKGTTYVSCAYGWRNHPIWGDRRFHYGVDLAASQGTPIYAIAAGTVTVASYGDANGYYVSLSHGNGYGSIYCHMTHYTVSVGQSVSQGEIIGYVGSTGWSTGPHLHFEIHLNGSSVNPMSYISLS